MDRNLQRDSFHRQVRMEEIGLSLVKKIIEDANRDRSVPIQSKLLWIIGFNVLLSGIGLFEFWSSREGILGVLVLPWIVWFIATTGIIPMGGVIAYYWIYRGWIGFWWVDYLGLSIGRFTSLVFWLFFIITLFTSIRVTAKLLGEIVDSV